VPTLHVNFALCTDTQQLNLCAHVQVGLSNLCVWMCQLPFILLSI